MKRLQRATAAALSALLALLPLTALAAAPLAALQHQVDALVRSGYDRPDDALAALAALAVATGSTAPIATTASSASGAAATVTATAAEAQRVLVLARGLVAANAGRADGVTAARQLLHHSGTPLAVADALLVQATLDSVQARVAAAGAAAQAALDHYRRLCPRQPGCDWRSSYLAAQLLARHSEATGRRPTAREQWLAAAEAARQGGDSARHAWALAAAADVSVQLNDSATAQLDMARAQRLARLDGSAWVLARIHIHETRMQQTRGDRAAARRAAEAGLVHARQARSPRLEAILLANLSDIHVKRGQPRAALQAVDAALPTVRRHGDRRIERVLLHNAALARVALGQGDAARRTLDELLQAHAASGADGDQVVVLREFADAFAAAGEPAAALALFHRERKLSADIAARNSDAALAALHKRFDSEAQARQLQQLARENALLTQQLDNRRAMHRVWMAGAVVVVLAVAVVTLLYRRVARINRRLAHNHAALHEQSQRDPLTGLANRRALHERAQALGLEQHFRGGLVLLDIDHFKQVNDVHGHARGDRVLQAVAERLAACVRQDDMVVRWGGEEFLILLPEAGPAESAALAERVLQAVGGTPVLLDSGVGLRVTVSVGHGSFPLPPAQLPLPLERAANLADMALYIAKKEGRNRAVGIAGTRSADPAALRAVEADFEQAWRDGSVALQQTLGPADAAGLLLAASLPAAAGARVPDIRPA